jgi:hypothetical protein
MGVLNRHKLLYVCPGEHFRMLAMDQAKTLVESASVLSEATRSYFSAMFLMR